MVDSLPPERVGSIYMAERQTIILEVLRPGYRIICVLNRGTAEPEHVMDATALRPRT
jgi:hypothetical protein